MWDRLDDSIRHRSRVAGADWVIRMLARTKRKNRQQDGNCRNRTKAHRFLVRVARRDSPGGRIFVECDCRDVPLIGCPTIPVLRHGRQKGRWPSQTRPDPALTHCSVVLSGRQIEDTG